MAEEGSCATQLINGEGEFNIAGLETFTRTVKLPEFGISYAVVAIIGPQSSGKSTLLNHLFNTNFLEMDAFKGRSQTTKGIWIARAVGIAPCTVIMDVEGSRWKRRGEKDETAFEKQSALFALVVSDVVLINMWCHDIGREQAANRPLLKTVFQVMMQLFSPRKTTLLFVIRDKTKTPLEYLEYSLREDIQQIWDTVEKPQAFKDTPLSDFFNVEVTALSSYDLKVDQFNEQVGQLRQQFFNSIAPGGLAGDRRGVVPASEFSSWAEKIWKDIKENRDLDLPSHRVMLASVRCDEIGSEQLTRLTSDESWLSLEEAVQAGPVPGFVQRLSSILETYLSEYDTMTLYYDENVRKTKRQELESKALQLVHPAYVIFLQQLRSETLESFKMSLEQTLHKGEAFASSVGKCTQACMKKFDFSCAGKSGKQTYWDASKVRGELLRDIEYTTNYHHPNIQKYLAVAEDAYAFTAGGDQVLSPLSKFNLEKAKTKKGFFNIRSCYNNKYVVLEDATASKGADSSDIGVGAAEPNEDPSQWSSTLVELVPTAGDVTSVKIRFANRRNFFTVEGEETQFTVINWESLMNLPKYVVLKGDNGKYLKVKADGVHYSSLKFDGSDIGDLALVHQVLPVGDGTIMMKPMLQKFSSAIHWHHWKSGMIGLNYPPSRFMPVKAGSNSIALRCMDNNLFCRIHPKVNGVKDTLVADSESIIKESRFIVEESFLSRDIFDMDFRLMHTRIYDQTVVTIITRDATNHSSSAETIDLKLTYTDTSTRTWDRSRGLKLGSSATIKAGVPLIGEGEVKLSADFEGSYKWGETLQTSTQIETTHTVTVPPKTRVKARLLATRGKCDVPFSYTVRDVLIDGQEFIHILDDGIYTGTNDYNFKVETTEEKLL